MRFLGEHSDVAIGLCCNRQFEVWRWKAIDTLVEPAVPFKRELYIDVVAALPAQQ